ncbi:hypothetical protein E8E11_002850 [Didymella keratinophila]|nr:hypothetical protein E8E11_002850 [Didymella keratinophila]
MSGSTNNGSTVARQRHSDRGLACHRLFSPLSYLLLLATAFYYALYEPERGAVPRHSFWQHLPSSFFSQSYLITSVYWIIVFLFQLIYLWSLWSSSRLYRNAATNVGRPYVASNLLLSGFIHLWVRSNPWLAELLLVINFFNLSFAYFRHPNTPLAIHLGALAGPLAWNFTALYWVGAVAVRATNLAARITAHLSIWGWLAYGLFYLVAYHDFAVGLALSALAASTGLDQLSSEIAHLHLQSIFAIAVAGTLFVLSLAVGLLGLLRCEPFPRRQVVGEDRETAPILTNKHESI